MRKNKQKKFRIGILIFRIISLIIIIICLKMLYSWHLENVANLNLIEDLSNTYEPKTVPDSDGTLYQSLYVNFDDLLAQNEFTVGWIKVNNTNINFPIVQAGDNEFYLTHNFNNKSNSAGWIFADNENNMEDLDKNTIIYGHNRRNETMFSKLKYMLNSEWFDNNEENKYFIFNTLNERYIAQIFSVYKVNKSKQLLFTSFENEESFYNFIDDCKENSTYDFNVDISYDDKIITLYTCDDNTKYRIVVFAKLIKLD